MKKNINLKFLVLILAISFLPSSASATSVFVESLQKNVSEGDTIILNVKINTGDIPVNAVEGDIIFSPTDSFFIKDFSLSGSALNLWTKTPAVSSDGKTVSFTGGVPSGFNSESATLFKIVVEAKKAGQINISPNNIVAYFNDGKGTKVTADVKDSMIVINTKSTSVSNDEWKDLLSSDNIPPEDFSIMIGKDDSVYDGKKFATFNSIDKQTGIDYYEVYEGNNKPVKSGITYVLQNQDKETKLKVVAYDKAGNKKIAQYPEKTKGGMFGFSTGFIFVVLLMIFIKIINKLKKIKK